jgi:uncharacterized RDD family membrane protein YckC
MEDNWHYAISGQGAHGPISKNDLGRILGSKANSAEFLVWCPGMADWARAGGVPALQEFFDDPPPIPVPSHGRNHRRSSPLVAQRSAQSWDGTKDASNQVSQDEKSAGTATHPWKRYFARLLDTWFFFIVFFLFLGMALPSAFETATSKELEKGLEQLYGFFALIAYAPFEAFCMHIFGNTAGKALYGIRVAHETGGHLSLPIAFKRAFAVWLRGWGLGIPIVTLFTLITAYRTLKNDGITSWDHDCNCIVSHKPLSYLRFLLLVIVWILLLSLLSYLISLS